MDNKIKIVGIGDNREVIHGCAWCGEFIDTLAGDDEITEGDRHYHYGCFEEMHNIE